MCRRFPESTSREVVAVSAPRRVAPVESFPAEPIQHAEALAAHVRQQSRELGELFMLTGGTASWRGQALQAGAASAEAMADFLDALNAGDAVTARGVLELFVSQAIESGVIAV